MYTGRTSFYGIPFLRTGDTLEESSEKEITQIIENQLRAGILAEGETRVYKEGRYIKEETQTGINLTLLGSPALRGIAKGGLVEVVGELKWREIPYGSIWYIYVKANQRTYLDPANVETVSEKVFKQTSDYLFLAILDTRERGKVQLDTQPEGKPIGQDLFKLLNNPKNPFGKILEQDFLEVKKGATINLSEEESFKVSQKGRFSKPLIEIENYSDQPDIKGKKELCLADKRIAVKLSDEENNELPFQTENLTAGIKNATFGKALKLNSENLSDFDAEKANVFSILITKDLTLGTPQNGRDGQICLIKLRQTLNKDCTVTLDSGYRLPKELQEVALSNCSGKQDILEVTFSEDDNKWDVLSIKTGFFI